MGDNTLAKSAQMYHYKHQKQQMISMGKWVLFLPFGFLVYLNLDTITLFSVFSNKPEQKPVDSEFTSDEEEVGGGFTVYECPGLAPVGRHAPSCSLTRISETNVLHFLLHRLERWRWRTLCLTTRLWNIRRRKSEDSTLHKYYSRTDTHSLRHNIWKEGSSVFHTAWNQRWRDRTTVFFLSFNISAPLKLLGSLL